MIIEPTSLPAGGHVERNETDAVGACTIPHPKSAFYSNRMGP